MLLFTLNIDAVFLADKSAAHTIEVWKATEDNWQGDAGDNGGLLWFHGFELDSGNFGPAPRARPWLSLCYHYVVV